MIKLVISFVFGLIILGMVGCWGVVDRAGSEQLEAQSKSKDDQSLIDKAKGLLGGDGIEATSKEAATEPGEIQDIDFQRHSTTKPVEKKPGFLNAQGQWVTNQLTYPNWGFWIGCIVLFILISLYAEYEDYDEYKNAQYAGNAFAGFLILSMVWLNRGVFVDLWEQFSWIGPTVILVAYVIAGVLNFWIKWDLKTRNKLDEIKGHEQEFLRNDPHGLDANGKPYDEVPDDKAVIQARNEYFERKRWTLDLPKKAEHKWLLTKWACTGPVSLPGTIVVNGLQIFGNFVYDHFGFLADRITKRHERQIRR